MGRIVVVGGLNMDLHLFGLRESAGQAPLVAHRYLAQPGGKGANVARAAARLGADVALIGRVGDDEFGRTCVAAVTNDGVDATGITSTRHAATGFVAIELTGGKHRSLVFAPGANALLTWSDVAPGLNGLGSADIVVAQAEIPSVVLHELADFAGRRGIALFLDPTPPDRVGRHQLAAADVITPDLAEAAQLVGRREGSQLWPTLAARELLEVGANRAIIKTSESGALLADERGLFEIPTLSVDVLDETGAGDVFLAALAVKRSEGADWEQATRFANAGSALSCAATGLILPTREMVDRELAKLVASPTLISPPR